jgi:hypothetical protein
MGGGPAAPPRSAAETAAIPAWADAAVDVSAAICSATAAAPFIMTVDKAVVEASAGHSGLGTAMLKGIRTMLTRPHHLIQQPSLWMVAGVYGVTYATANLIDTSCERMLDPQKESSAAVHGVAKLVGTTAVNMTASITKDVAFARMYGATGASGPMPKATIGFFAARDVLTIGAAFTMPKILATALIGSGTVDEKYAGETAQLISPIAMQVFCSPLHLMALHCYNVREATPTQRLLGVWKTLPETTLVRMCRMAPAYGVGGVLNTSLCTKGRDYNLQVFYELPLQREAAARAAAAHGREPSEGLLTGGADGKLVRRPSLAARRRRIMDTYAHRVQSAMDLLGDVDPATVESPLRQAHDAMGEDGTAAAFSPAGVGYYPNLAELVDQKLGFNEELEAKLAGLLGDSRDVPDLPTE